MPPKIEMYSQETCPWCHRAKSLLEGKGVALEEIIVAGDTPGWDEMIERTGGRTTPQILIDGEIIGGYTELAVLNAQGILDELLGLDTSGRRDELYDVVCRVSEECAVTYAAEGWPDWITEIEDDLESAGDGDAGAVEPEAPLP